MSGARIATVVGALIALPLLLGHGLLFDFVIDDAWISLRYARNLVEGQGLVFNPGQPVEGYSNLSWVLLAAVGLKAGVPALLWLRILGAACAAGLLLLLPGATARLAPVTLREPSGAGAAAQLVTAAAGPVACWTLGGLETLLFSLLIVLGWRAAMARRTLTAGLVALALVLTRPEGPALGAIFAAWSLLPGDDGLEAADRGGWRRWLGPALFVAGTIAYFVWRKVHFGYWLPNTYYAKTGDLRGQLATGLPYGLDFLLRYVLPLAAAAAVALIRGGWDALRARPSLLTLGLLGLWFGYAVLIGGDMLGMFRFFAPLLPVAIAWTAAILGAGGRLRGAGRSVLVLAPLMLALLYSSFNGRERRLVDIHMSEANLGGWILAGDALAKHLPPGTTIALGPAGYIPWRTGFETIDFYGIVTPAIAHGQGRFRHGYAGHEKTDGPWVVARRPDYILLGNVDITDAPRDGLVPPLDREVDIVLDPTFRREYEQIWLPTADRKVLNLFRRKDVVR